VSLLRYAELTGRLFGRAKSMASAGRQPILVIIEGVAHNFRSDWQYIIAASKVNSALSLVTMFSVLAVVTRFGDLLNLGTKAVYALLISSILYVAAITIIKLRAPAFLQDFQDYKAFEDKKNSHRWILWQFYHNLAKLKRGFSLLNESIDKQLSFESRTVKRKQCPVIPLYIGKHLEGDLTILPPSGLKSTYKMTAYEPFNFGRDLIMAFTLEEDKVITRYILPLREDDPKREEKCKELFWIIFTEAAKENKYSRIIAGALIQISMLLFAVALVLAVYHAMTRTAAPTPCDFKYI
jgi:hypothetical protein